MQEHKGSRKLNVKELFHILQLEYINCLIRLKIYYRPKDIAFWEKTALHKKSIIQDIALKNNFYSIFDDEKIMEDYKKKVIREFGIPDFIYKNEDHKSEQEYWDYVNFFSIDSEVEYEGQKYQIEKFNFEDKTVFLKQLNKNIHITSVKSTRCF